MAFKVVVLCVSALMVQCISAQYEKVEVSCGCGSGSGSVSGSISESGGALKVSSVGPLSPSGIAVATELGLAGELALSGALPFLSAVDFKGTFPTAGQASVAYGCGDGNIAIVEEIGNRCGKPISKSKY